MITLREWLHEIRDARCLTQEQVAKKVKITRAYYTQIESGDRRPSVEVAKAIANLLEFDWTDFFNEKVNYK